MWELSSTAGEVGNKSLEPSVQKLICATAFDRGINPLASDFWLTVDITSLQNAFIYFIPTSAEMSAQIRFFVYSCIS